MANCAILSTCTCLIYFDLVCTCGSFYHVRFFCTCLEATQTGADELKSIFESHLVEAGHMLVLLDTIE